MKNKLFLDLHVLQTVPASCLNRDDTGSPKLMTYGGKTRGRVSSQCWKHAMREMFKQESPEMCGIRSMWFTQIVRDYLLAHKDGLAQDVATEMSVFALSVVFGVAVDVNETQDDAGKKVFVIDYNTAKMNALTFLSQAQVEVVGNFILNNWDELEIAVVDFKKKIAKAAKKDDVKIAECLKSKKSLVTSLQKCVEQASVSADMALFGRMIAQSPSLSVDACCSVAHAFSTHEVATEFDYYTATDDYQPENVTGAANIGTLEFCSMTMYRYATVDVTELVEKMGVDAAVVLREFVRTFVMSMPTGKVHSYANMTLPEYIEISFRTDTPVSFAPAFENAVRGTEGMMVDSVKALEAYRENVYKMYDEPTHAMTLNMAQPTMKFVDALQDVQNVVETDMKEA